MLKHLSIKNYALIQNLEMDFNRGFSVITGETGAGKSILLGALGLVLGNRADTSVLLDKKNKCVVESHFEISGYGLESFFDNYELDYEELCMMRREITSQGKSRAFINDTPVTINQLRELGEKLVNIHSQHQTTTLNDTNFQLAVIDHFAGLQKQISEYRWLFQDYTKKSRLLESLVEQERKSRTDQDYLQFQLDELDKAKLKEGEQEEIEKELEILNHADEIKTALASSIGVLMNDERNILNQLTEINLKLKKLGLMHEGIQRIQQRLDSSIIELDDIGRDLEHIDQDIQLDPERTDELNARLDLIYQLQHKHRLPSAGELIKLAREIRGQIDSFASLGDQIEKLGREVNLLLEQLRELALHISKERQRAIPEMTSMITGIIISLGMPQSRLLIDHSKYDKPGIDGMDRVVFKFNPNKGGAPKEIAKIASGGELSRLMLAVKSLISSRNLLPTIIFDEIDAGVSGDIAGKVGKILRAMSVQMQVIVITHLPQIAGKGEHHYMVYKEIAKDQTVSKIRLLGREERIGEIAKLLSDEEITTSAVETARELLGVSGN